MDLDRYRRFTERLAQRLSGDPRVVGLVALGSTAEAGTVPDDVSDHDLFVVTVPGSEEAFRRDLSWLAGEERLVLSFRETEHGLKAITDEAHLVELAVFDLESLRAARVNRYRVLLDRGGVAERMAEVASATASAGAGPSDGRLAAGLVANLLVGACRAARGEELSARQFVTGHALRSLLVLLSRHAPRQGPGPLDDLDPFRRVEQAFPELSRELADAARRPSLEASALVLGIAVRELRDRTDGFPSAAAEAVERRIAGLLASAR